MVTIFLFDSILTLKQFLSNNILLDIISDKSIVIYMQQIEVQRYGYCQL